MWLRLRQICLVTRGIETVTAQLERVLGVAVCFVDPAGGAYGLVNRVMPVGNQFLELVSPLRAGTAAGRFLDLRAADADAALAGASELGLPVDGQSLNVGGVRFNLV